MPEMRIDELNFPGSIGEAKDRLEQAGYNQIGTGSFGRIFQKPGSSSVLKLFYKEDGAYRDYVDFCLRYQDNPHLPKFKRKTINLTSQYSAVRTELLTPVNSILREAVEVRSYASGKYRNFNKYIDVPKYLVDHPLLKITIDFIVLKLMHEKHHAFDMATRNMMMRGETLVITDPVA